MFVREKQINGYTYLYLVESVREEGRAKQRIIKNLGRKEIVVASGELERLASSVARYAERAMVLSQIESGNPEGLACKRFGAPLLFGRLWEEIQDLPRHLGQHSGGMVMCHGRLDDVVPLENASMPDRVVVQWDKDDCADMKIVKVDLLGLGMMSVLQDALELVPILKFGSTPSNKRGTFDRMEWQSYNTMFVCLARSRAMASQIAA